MNTIHSDKAPAAIGPYSQAIEANGFVFCSGQIGLDPESGALKETLAQQCQQIFENIDAVLEAAGTNKSKIVKTIIFVTNLTDYLEVNELYGAYVGENKPARSTVEVSALPKGALIEIEITALQ